MPTAIEVELVGSPAPDAIALLAELDAVLGAEYEPHQRHGLAIEALFQPGILFFIARIGGDAVGCGGVAMFEDFAEVKRMYSRPAVRGRGVGRALLLRIEAETRAGGKHVLRPETGTRQQAAMALYEHCGFSRCDAFGHYVHLRPEQIAESIFYEKRLS